jgi:hypothetical protein
MPQLHSQIFPLLSNSVVRIVDVSQKRPFMRQLLKARLLSIGEGEILSLNPSLNQNLIS